MSEIKHINVADTAKHLAANSAIICDIRDENSFSQGHIPSSLHLTSSYMPQLVNELAFDQVIIVVCYHGISSQGAAQYLSGLGFEQVYSMDGGFDEWAKHYAVDSLDQPD